MSKKILKTKSGNLLFPDKKILVMLLMSFQLLILSGCATTLSYDPAILRFDSPEVSGELLSGSAQYYLAVTNRRVLATIDEEIFDTEFKDSGKATDKNAGVIGVRSDIGAGEKIDIYVRAQTGSVNVVGAKYQLIGSGNNRVEKGLKVTVCSEFGYSNDSSTQGDRKRLSLFYSDYSVNIGYRLNSNWLVYVNNFYNRNKIDGALGRGMNYKYSVSGVSKGYGRLWGIRYSISENDKFLGLMVKPYVNLEFGGGNFGWLNTFSHDGKDIILNDHKDENSGAFGFSAGFSWN